jgi:hypothetical protein
VDENLAFIRYLYNINLTGSEITHNAEADVKSTAHFQNKESPLVLDDYDELIIETLPLTYLPLNESSGTTAADGSGNGRTGTYTNGPVLGSAGLLAGLSDTSVTLDGINDYIAIGDSAGFDSAHFTVAGWIKTTATSKALFDRDDGGSNKYVRVELDSNGQVKATLHFTTPASASFTATGSVNDGLPHFVVVTYDKVRVKIYVDSVLLLSTAETRTLNAVTLGWQVGRTNAGTLQCAGTFQSVSVNDYALSYNTIRNLYQSGTGDLKEIDYNRDLIAPYGAVRMPYNGSDGTPWAEFPLGKYLLSSPKRKAEETGVIAEIDAYDQSKILLDDLTADVYEISAGTNYITAVRAVAESSNFDTSSWSLTSTSHTLPVSRSWPIGTSKLAIINDLLFAINYRPFRFNEHGLGVAEAKVLPGNRTSEFTFINDTLSLIMPGAEDELELAAVPNEVVLVVNNSLRTTITATATNENINLPTSKINRRFNNNVFVQVVDVVNQTVLDEVVIQEIAERTATYRRNGFSTSLFFAFSDLDCITFTHSELGITSQKCIVMAWRLPLDPTAEMSVSFRSAVSV